MVRGREQPTANGLPGTSVPRADGARAPTMWRGTSCTTAHEVGLAVHFSGRKSGSQAMKGVGDPLSKP